MGRLDGKVAFITGVARGQGRSNALRLAQEGADIIGIDLCDQIATVPYEMASRADLAETVRLVEETGRRIIASPVDVRDFVAMAEAVDEGVAKLGRLDIVSANAGIWSPGGPTETISPDVWRDMIDVNLTGVWHTAAVSIPHIKRGGRGGSIVLTSSAAGLKPYEEISHYVSSKHAVVGLMRSLARELAPFMIRVNSLHPTQVNTEMIINETLLRRFCPGMDNPTFDDMAAVSMGMNLLPIPWVEPIDISNALLFLSCDEGRYITGVTLPVDAGTLLK